MTISSNGVNKTRSAGTTPLLNQALRSVPLSERVFDGYAHASLWFSLGVGLLVIQTGAYLVPGLSPCDALFAIVLGTALGAGLLAWTAQLGARSGLASAGLMHQTYGSSFARLPVVLNIAQLIGWTTFELVIMREGTQSIAKHSFGLDLSSFEAKLGITLVWGLFLTVLLAGSMTQLVRKIVARYSLPLVIASLLWLTWQFATKMQMSGWTDFWARRGDGNMSLLAGMDLVIAMPISWLPLVADYARFSQSERSAFTGTWLGYALANLWCFALGVVVTSVSQPGADLLAALLLAQGGLVALSLILLDEVDNAYGDVYSSAVSFHSLLPKLTIRHWGVALALLCTALALVLPIHDLEPFLMTLSSIFVPLYGVILGRLGGIKPNAHAPSVKVDYVAAGIWILGIAIFQSISKWAPQWGATLPTLLLTGVAALLSRQTSRSTK